MPTLREEIFSADRRASEASCVARLLSQPPYDDRVARGIAQQAGSWVSRLRAESDKQTLLDTFLSEYGLSSEEGVALMCLAEAFLRVPDAETATLLIQDKLASRDWRSHLGHAESWLVNSSTWALMLTGTTLQMRHDLEPNDWINGLLHKLGEPLMRRAIGAAMQILGKEFVLGETIDKALARSEPDETTSYSFDMLGEGARERASAGRYRQAYEAAIVAVGEARLDAGVAGHGVSIKLSALHPRYEPLQRGICQPQLLETLVALGTLAKQHQVPLTIDAEESERVLLSLDLFAKLCSALAGWDGLGMVVQAYDKRAPAIIGWLAELAKKSSRCIPVRLVKGAYWDAEIKRAQELGFAEFPVYTQKATTDAAYLYCANKMLHCRNLLYPQFATHNAHTIAAILHMAQSRTDFECQRLHGMGEQLYDVVRAQHPQLRLRVYAPVGHYTDLLAYLVRRLLENGANSSFVNRLQNAELPLDDLLRDPYELLRAYDKPENSRIAHPWNLYGARRQNSTGLDLSDRPLVEKLWPSVAPNYGQLGSTTVDTGQPASQPTTTARFSPADDGVALGSVSHFPAARLDGVFEAAHIAQSDWDEQGGHARAKCVEALAGLIEEHKSELYGLLCHEAGKTIADCVDEVREAVDFCRFYAAQARDEFAVPVQMPGPTGETNHLSLHGRGVLVCISPWNFPLAIFIGQVSAALLAGNAVIAKPAEPTPGIAHFVVGLVHAAGIPLEICQLVLGGQTLGESLVDHPLCRGVVFTGSIAVAKRINVQLAQREGAIYPLIAETGGQNAMIVDSTALLEQVTDDVVRSAFLSSGQRCSALRLLCLQEDMADAAIAMITGAMSELKVGHPQDVSVDMGPIITRQGQQALLQYVQECRGRGFAISGPDLKLASTGNYMAPVLVEIGSVEDLGSEQFGPVLHVLRYAGTDLAGLLTQINNTGFGLTFGVHTRLDERADRLATMSRAGNVYINRNITGAVVGTQPFGGQGLSGTGPKAGGPNYLSRFAVEKTVSRNVTATGGNLALLQEEQD